ncbi:hypothetical protein MXB_1810 [Myxobolus squamalis]|nr:hypothetical protein MXB_1810 [Myxobolus squamalis]
MTSNEMKFALLVESALNSLLDPEYRQIMIETMMVLGQLLSIHSNTSLKGSIIKLDMIIDKANELFLANQMEVNGDATSCCAGRPRDNRKCPGSFKICQFFFDSAPSGEYGTMNFLSRSLLSFLYASSSNDDNPCRIT